MKVQVLISTMNRDDYGILDLIKVKSSAVVVNQCGCDSVDRFEFEGNEIIWINSKSKGLSHSRNLALSYATGDICLLCDDDEVLVDNYVEIIKTNYVKHKVDIIVFNFIAKNAGDRLFKINKDRSAPWYRYYVSQGISFRRMAIKKNGIFFNELLGAGTVYGSGEESLFIRRCRNSGLTIRESSSNICTVDFGESSWFKGFDEQFFFNIGVFLKLAYRKMAILYCMYYLFLFKPRTSVGKLKRFQAMLKGMSHFDSL